MAAASPASTDLECPVCLKDFQDPKLLPCTHLVCRKCVLSWLSTPAAQGGCPLCRAPILSSPLPAGKSLDSCVDDLPTDLAVQSVIQTQKFLSSSHVCSLCDGGVAASSYCLQCTVKLCSSCIQKHMRIPCLQNHVVEDLNQLTAERLAETCRMPCKNHADRLVELYCSSHQELICMLCFPTNHRECGEVKAVSDVARQKRAELKDWADSLLGQEARLSTQIQARRNEYKQIQKKAEDAFDDLENTLKQQRQTVMADIQTEVEARVTSLSKMEAHRTGLKARAGLVRKLASSASNDALLGMLGRLERSEQTTTEKMEAMVFTFKLEEVARLKESVLSLGGRKRLTCQETSGCSDITPPASAMPSATLPKSIATSATTLQPSMATPATTATLPVSTATPPVTATSAAATTRTSPAATATSATAATLAATLATNAPVPLTAKTTSTSTLTAKSTSPQSAPKFATMATSPQSTVIVAVKTTSTTGAAKATSAKATSTKTTVPKAKSPLSTATSAAKAASTTTLMRRAVSTTSLAARAGSTTSLAARAGSTTTLAAKAVPTTRDAEAVSTTTTLAAKATSTTAAAKPVPTTLAAKATSTTTTLTAKATTQTTLAAKTPLSQSTATPATLQAPQSSPAAKSTSTTTAAKAILPQSTAKSPPSTASSSALSPQSPATSSAMLPSSTSTQGAAVTSPETSSTSKPTGKELIEMLKEGVRVVAGPGWMSKKEDGGGPGTVVKVVKHPISSAVFVNVKWDLTGILGVHRMTENRGELELL